MLVKRMVPHLIDYNFQLELMSDIKQAIEVLQRPKLWVNILHIADVVTDSLEW